MLRAKAWIAQARPVARLYSGKMLLGMCALTLSASAVSIGYWPEPTGERAWLEPVGQPAPLIRMFSTDRTLAKMILLYRDRGHKSDGKVPAQLEGCLYYEAEFGQAHSYRCTRAGSLFVVLPLGMQPGPGVEPAADGGGFQLWGDKPEGKAQLFARRLQQGEMLSLPPGAIVAGFDVPRAPTGEMLYNGIRLPREWPPRIDWRTDEPLAVPYLESPPRVIFIDVGRQLLVDDFLIESTDMEREYHYPIKYVGNPILKPETEIEFHGSNNLAVAGPKSGGLWWNSGKQLFELWYEAGWVTTIAYATSRDGLHWTRPDLPLNPGTNQVLPSEIKPDSWTVVRDYTTPDPTKNFKIFLRGGGARDRARYFVSRDGLDWGVMREGGLTGDRSTMLYNPFRRKWVYSLRWDSPGGRSRAYWEADDFEQGMNWLPDEPRPWARADRLDPPDPRIDDRPQLYNLDAVAYESIMLGFFEILHGPSNDVNAAKGLPKNTGLNFAYSRDGFHWHRPDRKIAINSEQAPVWDRGYVQSLGNICTVRGDKLWFYYIGFAGDSNVKLGDPGVGQSSMRSGLYANGATGVAFLRRDGFASLNAGDKPALLTTRPLVFSGRHLFANVDAPHGALAAEILDLDGRPIEPFTFANCRPLTGDVTLGQIHWRGGDDLTALANRTVRISFRLQTGKFYSFWVSRDDTGRSDGYVAGGGPGFTSDVDTVGQASLEAEAALQASMKAGSPER